MITQSRSASRRKVAEPDWGHLAGEDPLPHPGPTPPQGLGTLILRNAIQALPRIGRTEPKGSRNGKSHDKGEGRKQAFRNGGVCDNEDRWGKGGKQSTKRKHTKERSTGWIFPYSVVA